MSILDALRERGLLDQVTNEVGLRDLLAAGGAPVYIGFDPTAASLHVGHMLQAIVLRHLQRCGCRPIALVGGATGMIGDPSGRGSERSLLTAEQVEANCAGLRSQLATLLDFEGETAAVLVNNADWTVGITFIDWLRDIGKHFSVNAMIAKESVRRRLEDRDQGISYTEFSYMLLQAHDFLVLHDRLGCRIQAGGSDQWGNITAGIDLVRRKRGVEVMGFTVPLMTTSAGEKFGKSAGNAVWLDPALTSPYAFYQFWIRQEDADVERLLLAFTFVPVAEIRALVAEHVASPERRMAQRRLAEEVTRMVHGEAGLHRAQQATEILFGREIDGLGDAELGEIFAEVPSVEVPRTRLVEGWSVVDALVESGASKSRGDARRLLGNGGVYVNNRKVSDEGLRLTAAHLASETSLVLRTGKRSYFLVRFVP